MSREKTLEALIIKKQDLGETDQIITLFSREEGKLRCIVKAAKLPTSKLQPALQPLFVSKVTIVGAGALPKVIRAQTQQVHSGIFGNDNKTSSWFVVSEILNRALPDGAPNEQLYHGTLNYLKFLSSNDLEESQVRISLVQFQMKAMEKLGLGIRRIRVGVPQSVWFSMEHGGFFAEDPGADGFAVDVDTYKLYLRLLHGTFSESPAAIDAGQRLQKLVKRFVEYQLEREIKSARFL